MQISLRTTKLINKLQKTSLFPFEYIFIDICFSIWTFHHSVFSHNFRHIDFAFVVVSNNQQKRSKSLNNNLLTAQHVFFFRQPNRIQWDWIYSNKSRFDLLDLANKRQGEKSYAQRIGKYSSSKKCYCIRVCIRVNNKYTNESKTDDHK